MTEASQQPEHPAAEHPAAEHPAAEHPDRPVGHAAADGSPLDVMLTDAALGPLRRLAVGTAGLQFATRLAARPVTVGRRTAGATAELARIVAGRSEVAPAGRDRRFADPAWTGNPLLKRLCQAYLVGSRTLEQLVEDASLDWRAEQRIRFAVEMIVDAAAPSNAPFVNPQALKAAIDTGGRNYLTGAGHLLRDMSRRPRIPSMVDTDPFTIGENIAVTPGSVVLRTPVVEVIQYRPQTEKVREVPLLIVPPMINKFYVADLAPGRSMIEHFVRSGQQVFTISWRNPDADQRDWNLDTYAGAILDALDAVRDITGAPSVHLLALCAGGVVSTAVVAHLAAIGEADRIAGLTLGVTMLDQHRAGTVGAFVDPATAALAVAGSARRGYLDGRALAGVFAWLRPNDLIWNYWVNNYLLGKKPPAFDVLFWNADTTRMPAGLHRDFIQLALDNALVHPNTATVRGTQVDLSKITTEMYVVAGISDHICPWENCYRTVSLVGSSPRFVLSTSGHIAALVNPVGTEKASFQVNDALPEDPGSWLAGATRHRGSWWSDYVEWLAARSGDEVAASAEVGDADHPPLADAPGTYVRTT